MLREMAWKACDLSRQFKREREAVFRWIKTEFQQFVEIHFARPPARNRTRQSGDFALAIAKDFRNFACGGARAIGDDGSRQSCAITPIALINILHDFFAPLMLEIDINVRRLATLG